MHSLLTAHTENLIKLWPPTPQAAAATQAEGDERVSADVAPHLKRTYSWHLSSCAAATAAILMLELLWSTQVVDHGGSLNDSAGDFTLNTESSAGTRRWQQHRKMAKSAELKNEIQQGLWHVTSSRIAFLLLNDQKINYWFLFSIIGWCCRNEAYLAAFDIFSRLYKVLYIIVVMHTFSHIVHTLCIMDRGAANKHTGSRYVYWKRGVFNHTISGFLTELLMNDSDKTSWTLHCALCWMEKNNNKKQQPAAIVYYFVYDAYLV